MYPDGKEVLRSIPLRDYCNYIRGSRVPTEGYGIITKLTRYQRNYQKKHMFTIMRIDVDMVGIDPFNFWIRIDRWYDKSTATSSIAPAKDQVSFCAFSSVSYVCTQPTTGYACAR